MQGNYTIATGGIRFRQCMHSSTGSRMFFTIPEERTDTYRRRITVRGLVNRQMQGSRTVTTRCVRCLVSDVRVTLRIGLAVPFVGVTGSDLYVRMRGGKQGDRERNYRVTTVRGWKYFRLCEIIRRKMQALPLKPCQFVLADGCTVRDIVRRKQSDRKRNYRVATVRGFKRLLLCKVIEREGKVFPCKVLQFRRTNGSAIRDTVRIGNSKREGHRTVTTRYGTQSLGTRQIIHREMQSLPSEFVQGRRTDGSAVCDIIIHRQQRDGEGNY